MREASRPRHPELERARLKEIDRLIAVTLSSDPADDDPWALTLHGVMLNREKRWAEAIREFNQALDLNGAMASALNSRCWARGHLPGQAEAAIKDCRAGLVLNPKSFETMDSLANVLDQDGQVEQAFATVRCAKRLSSTAKSVETTYKRLQAKLPNATLAPLTDKECSAIIKGAPVERSPGERTAAL